MSEQGQVSKVLESPVIIIVGAVADFAAVYLLLSNDAVLLWIRDHPKAAVLITATLLLVVVGLLNAWVRWRSIGRRALKELESVPTPQDVRRFAEFWDDFGLESCLYKWLSENFRTNHARSRDLSALDAVVAKWAQDPTNYHNRQLCDEFDALKSSLTELHDRINFNYFPVGESTKSFGVPSEWELDDPSRWQQALDEILDSYRAVMSQHGNFLKMAHRVKVTDK